MEVIRMANLSKEELANMVAKKAGKAWARKIFSDVEQEKIEKRLKFVGDGVEKPKPVKTLDKTIDDEVAKLRRMF
jgi:hypothetical protein